MDAERFDALLRSISETPSRRGLLAGVTSGLLVVVPFRLGSEDAAAKKKRKKKKKRNQSPPTCSDGIKNGIETGVDCGGTCPRCSNDQGCAGGNDCESGLCVNQTCRACSGPNDCGPFCFCAARPSGRFCASNDVINLGLGSTCSQCPSDNLLYCSQEGLIAYCVYRCGT